MRAKRPRGLAGYTPDWRERLGEKPPRRHRSPRSPDRRSKRVERPEPSTAWPRGPVRIALACALLEIGLLVWLLAGPALQVRDIHVLGTQHLTDQTVLAAAGLERPGSILAVNPRSVEHRVDALRWVRTASVAVQLPATVVIAVDEWSPAATYQAGPTGKAFFLNDQGVVLGPAAGAMAPFPIEGPAGRPPSPGTRPIDSRLLTAMINMDRVLPGLIGVSAVRYQVDAAGDLTLVTSRGWPIQFGRVLTPEQFRGLDQQLAALKSVSACVDFRTASIQYVNVMNPSAPDVRYTKGGSKPCRS